MRKSTLLIFIISAIICVAWVKKEPVRPEQFFGKWFIADWKIDGVTDPDFVAECDSTTYILRADGTFTFCRVWYKRSTDTTTVCGTWEYYEKKNQLHFQWSNPRQKKTEKWQLQSSDATTIVRSAGNYEIHYQKAP